MTTRAPAVRRVSAGLVGVAVVCWVSGAAGERSRVPAEVVVHAQTLLSADDLWLAPAVDPAAPSDLARAAGLVAAGRAAEAVPILVRQTGDPELGGYAHLYLGRAHLALGHEDQAL